MWRTTGDVKWREHGYKIFQAIEKQTRTKFGYTTVSLLSDGGVSPEDYMPRYYILFYLYIQVYNNLLGVFKLTNYF